jgi:hypothetical protein
LRSGEYSELKRDAELAVHAANVERAHAAGLWCRPVVETVADTWAWMSRLGGPLPLREDLAKPGLAASREREILAAWHAKSSPTGPVP